MRRTIFGVSLIGCLGALASAPLLGQGQGQPAPAPTQTLNPPIAHDAKQNIVPSFEGWYKNPDGTLSLSFGYLNRNYIEEPDVPVGPNNHFSPGPEDRGQPTHFLPRRNWGMFAVVVPKETLNDKSFKLTWTLTVHGQTVSIPGHLRPEWEIDALKEATSGNQPPTLKFQQNGPSGQGPLGITTSTSIAFPGPATLTVFASDDGIKKRDQEQRPGSAPPLGVAWSKFRGPGTVKFAADSPKLEAGKATTTATFSEPGEYILRLHAWDDSGRYAGGFQCCWSNAYMKVNVTGTKSQSR